MRIASIVVGIIAILLGIIWTLQGINILQGSVMTGDPFWAIVGVIMLIVGAILTLAAWRRGRPSQRV